MKRQNILCVDDEPGILNVLSEMVTGFGYDCEVAQDGLQALEKFKKGKYNTLVTSQVLDEGIDVPDASVGYIFSGTGSSREFIQRLGRLLRKV